MSACGGQEHNIGWHKNQHVGWTDENTKVCLEYQHNDINDNDRKLWRFLLLFNVVLFFVLERVKKWGWMCGVLPHTHTVSETGLKTED
jgi:hypothetical protein